MQILVARHLFDADGKALRELRAIAGAACRRGHGVTLLTSSEELEDVVPRGVEVVLAPRSRRGFLQRLALMLREGGPHRVSLGLEPLPGVDYCLPGELLLQTEPASEATSLALNQEKFLRRRLLQQVFRNPSATRIFFTGPLQERTLLTGYGVPLPRLRGLPPWMDDLLEEPDPTPQDVALMRQAYGCQEEGTILILQPAADWRQGGVDRSLEALAILPPYLRERCRFLVAGEPSPQGLALLQEASRALGFPEGQLRYLPTLQHRKCLMMAADLLLTPARNDYGSMLLGDALQCALPVLCTSACGLSPLASAAGCPVLQAPFDQELLNESLAWLLPSLKPLRQRLRQQRERMPQDQHSWGEGVLECLEEEAPPPVPPMHLVQEALREHGRQVEKRTALKMDRKRRISRCRLSSGERLVVKEFRKCHFWEGDRHARRCRISTGRMLGFTPQIRAGGTLEGSDSTFLLMEDCGQGNFFGTEYARRPDAEELYAACGRLLADLHHAGIFHLDTKPANFVLNQNCRGECPYPVCLVDCDHVRLLSLPMPRKARLKNLAQFLVGTGRLAREDEALWLRCLRAFQEGYAHASLLPPDALQRLWDDLWKSLEAGARVEYTLPRKCKGEDLQFLRSHLH